MKTRKIITLTIVSFLLSALLFLSGTLDTFEPKAFDLFSRHLNPGRPGDEIIIVEVDQQSIDALSKEGVNWPWPRQIYAPIIEYLSEADAVFIDIIFSEPSSYGEQDDLIFAEAIEKGSNVYLPIFLSSEDKPITEKEREFIGRFAIKEQAGPLHPSYISAVTPVDALKGSVAGTGNVMIKPDRDGVYRAVPLTFRLGEDLLPNFVLSYLINNGKASFKEGEIYVDKTSVPIKENRLLLRFFSEARPFPAEPAVKIIRSYLAESASAEPEVPKEHFRGKKVFIGLTAAGLYDLKPTAVSAVSTGVLVHATALENLINHNYMTQVSGTATIFLIFLVCLMVSLAVMKHQSIYFNLSFFLLLLAVISGILALLFKKGHYSYITPPVMSLILSFIIAAAYSYATEGKERRFVRRAFSQYMDSTVVDYILENPDIIKPGGQRKRMTIFFTDIAGFTTMAEKMPAEQTAKILHTILNSFSEVIISNKGVIDKYIGDAIMAFWGAPLSTEEDETNACLTATRCLDSLREINDSLAAEGLDRINIRIGIHTGDAIVGNLGSDRLFDFTAIGDTVNLASRLEGVNKAFGTRIIVSEETLKKTGDRFLTRDLGLIEVKGKSLPVRIFELVSERDMADNEKAKAVSLFHEGTAFFQEKRWQEAVGRFNDVLVVSPGDGPSLFYLEWCKSLADRSDLTDDWNVFKLTVK